MAVVMAWPMAYLGLLYMDISFPLHFNLFWPKRSVEECCDACSRCNCCDSIYAIHIRPIMVSLQVVTNLFNCHGYLSGFSTNGNLTNLFSDSIFIFFYEFLSSWRCVSYLNSGFSSGLPSFMLPYFEKKSTIMTSAQTS